MSGNGIASECITSVCGRSAAQHTSRAADRSSPVRRRTVVFLTASVPASSKTARMSSKIRSIRICPRRIEVKTMSAIQMPAKSIQITTDIFFSV